MQRIESLSKQVTTKPKYEYTVDGGCLTQA
jgi:hypothetical protein